MDGVGGLRILRVASVVGLYQDLELEHVAATTQLAVLAWVLI